MPATLCAVLILGWLAQGDFVPAGPDAADPGFGSGSDWDIQWASAEAARVALAAGELPVWDPFPDYGTPVLAHPEAFVAHPAYFVGALHSVPRGLHWLYGASVLVLVLGFAWLAVELGLPWFIGLPAAAAVLASFEWEQRLYAGHLMFLGATMWPVGLAAVVRALRGLRSLPWAALGGVAVGLGSLGGGHYPTLFAPVLLGLAVWARLAPARWAAVLLFVAALGLLPVGPQSLRWGASACVAAILAAGLWRAAERQRALTIGLGFALGVLATAGARLVPGFMLGRAVGRVRLDGVGRVYDAAPILEIASFSGEFEGALRLASPLLGVALLLAAVALLVRRRESAVLVVPVLVLTLLAWSAGRPLSAWPLLHLGPGMTGVNYPLRLQWVFLYFAPLAAAWLCWDLLARWEQRRSAFVAGLSLLVTGGLLWMAPVEGRVPDGRPITAPPPLGRVSGLHLEQDEQHLLANAAADGLIRVGQASALGFGPPGAPPSLAGLSVQRSEVLVQGSIGDLVVVPQRHLAGWSCDGASLPAPDGARFLAVTLTVAPATCRYRPPGLALGVLVQLVALVLLAWYWRATPAYRAAPARSEKP